MAGVQHGRPLLEDGRVLEVANVVWCTGFRTDFSWIDLPAFDGDGRPLHERGVVDAVPGLYFAGLIFQYSLTSDVLPNGGRDADYVARHIAARGEGRREHDAGSRHSGSGVRRSSPVAWTEFTTTTTGR